MRKRLPILGTALWLASGVSMWGYSTQSANSPLFYGYNPEDPYAYEPRAAAGLYSFNAGQGGDYLAISAASGIKAPKYAAYADGKYYVLEVISSFFGETINLYCYDATDWTQLSVNTLPFNPGRGLAASADGKKLYSIQQGMEPGVVEIDLSTFECKKTVDIPDYLYINDVCVDGEGNVLTFNSTNYKLHKTDLATGVTTESFKLPEEDVKTNSSFYDKATGLVYFITTGNDGVNKLNSLDPTTGTVTVLGEVPSMLSPVGIYFPAYSTEVPAAVANISFEYAAPGSTEATLTFTMPSVTVGGESLSGNLDAVVVVDGVEEATSHAAGSEVSIKKTLATGNHTFSVFARNSEGLSPERRFVSYCGLDLPCEVQNLSLAIDENGVATVTWNAPVKSQNGGEFDSSALTYDVIREPNSVLVSENQKGLSFTETLGEAYARYYYRVIPRIGESVGLEASTEPVKWGTVLIPPFVEDFEDWESFEGRFATYNALDDGYGWSNMGGNVLCMSNDAVDADYWLFTPAMRLKANETYTLSFDTSINDYDYADGLMEVYVCREQNTDGVQPLMEKLVVPYGASSFRKEFKVEGDGTYYLAFRNVTPCGGPQLSLDNIGVEVNSAIDAPAAVENLSAVAGAEGALTAGISFTLPGKNADGTALASVESVEVVNLTTGKKVGTVASPSADIELTDNEAVQGFNIYEAYAVASGKKGMSSYARVFVGKDIPVAVSNLRAVQTTVGKATLSWDAVPEKGVNGGYVNPEDVTYVVNRFEEVNGYYGPEIANDIKNPGYVDESFAVPENGQAMVKYVVKAVSPEGTGAASDVVFTFGTPYPLPFFESMEGGEFSNNTWDNAFIRGDGLWSLNNGEATTVKPYDTDNGMLQFVNTSTFEATADFRSPRISMQNASDPEISFFMYHGYEAEPEDLTLTVYATADDGEAVELATISYNNGEEGWKRHALPLSRFIGNDNIYIDFKGRAIDGSAPIFIDKIKVASVFANDAELTGITIAPALDCGENKATVDVTNLGKNEASFTVTLYKGDETVSSEDVSALASGESRSLAMDMGVTVADAGKTLEYHAEIVMENDENVVNNKSKTVSTLVRRNTLPTVELEGETEEYTVNIHWEKPIAKMTAPVTDGFEDYSAYALNNFGNWITYDADGCGTEFSKYWTQIPNAKSAMAFEVWDNVQVKSDGFFNSMVNEDEYKAHDGEKALIAFTAVDASWFGEFPAANDNWLISPEVTGVTDMEFYVKSLGSISPETIEVLYTEDAEVDATAPDISKFVFLGSFSHLGHDWRAIKVTLPAEAKRFAIRHTTQSNSAGIMIDDVTYTPASGNERDIVAKGYNVYRDGEHIATVGEESFTEDLEKKGVYVYYVTTLWDEGESCVSNNFYAEIEQDKPSSVETVEGVSAAIETGDGYVMISVASPCGVIVSSLSGAVVYSGEVDGNVRIDLESGVYAVSVGGRCVKVIVR